MNTKQILKIVPKFSQEEQEQIAHTPIEDDHTKASINEEHKTDDMDIRKLVSNSDAIHSWEDEREGIYQDYLK